MGSILSSTKKVHSKHQPGLKEGDKVPNVVIKARIRTAPTEEVSSFVWKDIMIADLFKGKRVVVFSIPGGKFVVLSCVTFTHTKLSSALLTSTAFTPVCSCDHLPSYMKLYGKLKVLILFLTSDHDHIQSRLIQMKY